MKCRHCQTDLQHMFVDLGFAPPSNAYLSEQALSEPEMTLPLRVRVCHECWLVQTEDYAKADVFFNKDYAYFSSASSSWLAHAADYSQKMIKEFSLGTNSLVVELASNDGYLLKNFVAADIPCLGIEPTHSTADAARKLGIPVLEEFFGQSMALRLAAQGQQADLIAANNVYAHVPDINDFTCGIEALLKPEGVVTIEFPHLMELLQHNQFDTIYHEHFSYLSLHTVSQIFKAHGLKIFHIEQLLTHGGSLRVYGCKQSSSHLRTDAVSHLLQIERQAGMQTLIPYKEFQKKVDTIKNELLTFLIDQKKKGRKVAAYGAAAKGNTLLNYAGIKPDLLAYVCDAAPSKQGKYMPGSHLPIFSPEKLQSDQLEYLLILPWNIAQEVKEQLHNLRDQGVIFMAAIPQLHTI
jgi:2-polyprenyl-3-methyl-5-hydroxy-6-metoxy-1,4-benzoquinol methylase